MTGEALKGKEVRGKHPIGKVGRKLTGEDGRRGERGGIDPSHKTLLF